MIVKISQDKVHDLSENIGKGLRYIGKAMQCVDEMQQEEMQDMNERMGMRQGVRGTGPYSRYGRRDDWDNDMDPEMGMRNMGMRMRGGYRDPYYM